MVRQRGAWILAFSIQENEEKRKRQQDEDIRNLLKYIKEFRKVHKKTDKVPLYARKGILQLLKWMKGDREWTSWNKELHRQ